MTAQANIKNPRK